MVGVLREVWRSGSIDRDTLERLIDLPIIGGRPAPAGRCLTSAEVERLYTHSNAQERGILDLMLRGGLRRAEVAGLRPGDVTVLRSATRRGGSETSEPHDSTLHLTLLLSKEEDGVVADGVACPGRDFGDPIGGVRQGGVVGNDATQQLLQVRVAGKGGKERLVVLVEHPPPHHLPPTKEEGVGWRQDGQFGVQTIWRRIRSLAARAGVAPFTPHDLRRTFCSNALAAGCDLVTVQRAMGHSSPRTTAGYDRRGLEAQLDLARRLTGSPESGKVRVHE